MQDLLARVNHYEAQRTALRDIFDKARAREACLEAGDWIGAAMMEVSRQAELDNLKQASRVQ